MAASVLWRGGVPGFFSMSAGDSAERTFYDLIKASPGRILLSNMTSTAGVNSVWITDRCMNGSSKLIQDQASPSMAGSSMKTNRFQRKKRFVRRRMNGRSVMASSENEPEEPSKDDVHDKLPNQAPPADEDILHCIFPDPFTGSIYQAAVDQLEEAYDALKNETDKEAEPAIRSGEWQRLIINNNYGGPAVRFRIYPGLGMCSISVRFPDDKIKRFIPSNGGSVMVSAGSSGGIEHEEPSQDDIEDDCMKSHEEPSDTDVVVHDDSVKSPEEAGLFISLREQIVSNPSICRGEWFEIIINDKLVATVRLKKSD